MTAVCEFFYDLLYKLFQVNLWIAETARKKRNGLKGKTNFKDALTLYTSAYYNCLEQKGFDPRFLL